MVRKYPEIIALAEDAVKRAPIDEVKLLAELVRDLAIHVSNLDLHIRRLELGIGGPGST
jgi:hypothetical protein